ncbi:glycosyl hydrolase family 28-related protein [Sphingobacterium sp. HMA12]|uniref:glycosyl hydrolase family 28-related protein n=1 Tax=Sphingobacterium sp. HMA12 TaxID=2050894 RepID=UPI000CE9D1D3|nr:glycosyl hydrolase family 28-related protein [Sphingobacterium sp. HMA12]
MANQFLIKETMDAMRNLSATEIAGLQGTNPIYAGVQLLGYYEKGDTPAPIIYYYVNPSTDPGPDDGGSVIEIGVIKLRHVFDKVSVKYFGAKGDGVQDDSTYIQKAINYVELQNFIKALYVDSGDYFIGSTVNINKGGFRLEGIGALMREESYKERTDPIVSRAKSFRGTSFIIKTGITGFRVTSTATDHIFLHRLQFTTENDVRRVGNTVGFWFNSDFNGPLWTVNISECHFRGFNKAVRVSSSVVNYCVAFMNIYNNAFSRNDEVIYFDTLEVQTPDQGTMNNVEGFRFIFNKCHDNSRVLRIYSIADRTVIEDNNFEGNIVYADGTVPSSIVTIELRSGLEIKGNHFEGTTVRNIEVFGKGYGQTHTNYPKVWLKSNTFSVVNPLAAPLIQRCDVWDYDGYPYELDGCNLIEDSSIRKNFLYPKNLANNVAVMNSFKDVIKYSYNSFSAEDVRTTIVDEGTNAARTVMSTPLGNMQMIPFNYVASPSATFTFGITNGATRLQVFPTDKYCGFSFLVYNPKDSQFFMSSVEIRLLVKGTNPDRIVIKPARKITFTSTGYTIISAMCNTEDLFVAGDEYAFVYGVLSSKVPLQNEANTVFISSCQTLFVSTDATRSVVPVFKWNKDLKKFGTLRKGDIFLDTDDSLKTVKTDGTIGILTGITGSIEANSNKLTLSGASEIYIGQYLKLNNGSFRVVKTEGVNIYLDRRVTSIFTHIPVDFFAPTYVNIGVASTTERGLVRQAAQATNSAAEPSASYSQSEVQAILAELRDLKAKLRTAGILAS